MKVLITGASGFIGQRALKELKSRDIDVVALSSKKLDGIDTIESLDYAFNNNYLLNNGCEDVEVLLHIGAWTPKESKDANNVDKSLENITSTMALLKSNLPSLKKIVFASTLDVYIDTDKKINENTPTIPSTMYGWSKIYCENAIKNYCIENNVLFEILRIGHVYGEGEEVYKKVMPVMIKMALNNEDLNIYGNGKSLRTFIYIKDVANAIVNSLNLNESNIINIVGNEEISINSLANKIRELVNNDINIIHIKPNIKDRNICFDNKKLMTTLLDKLTPLDEGLNKEIAYMKGLNK